MTMRRLVGIAGVLAPLLHTITDLLEWWHGGFSELQLWLNYAAFLPMPALMIGLYAMQRPQIGRAGLWGALLYGGSFIYFAHTTLLALFERTSDYATLWGQLGVVYTIHGVAMVVGGFLFGRATLRAGVMPRAASVFFLAGLAFNLGVGLLPVPEILQTLGSGVRNFGLVLMGWHLLRPQAKA